MYMLATGNSTDRNEADPVKKKKLWDDCERWMQGTNCNTYISTCEHN